METLLEKTRQINKLMQQKNAFEPAAELPYNNMARILGDVLGSLTYIIGAEGELLGLNEKIDINTDRVRSFLVDRQFPDSYVSGMKEVFKTEANIPVANELTLPKWIDDGHSNFWFRRTFRNDHLSTDRRSF